MIRYSNKGDWVLDQFVGSGTTLVEAKLLDRNAIGIDINPRAISLSTNHLKFAYESNSKLLLRVGNAQKIDFIPDNSIDFICTHPPYAHIIRYSHELENDISRFSMDMFLKAMKEVASESYRVLKKGKQCAIMMGDIRKHGDVVPLGFWIMNIFLEAGFKSKEIIIKEQHNCSSTKYWNMRTNKFLLLAHEYIFVFSK